MRQTYCHIKRENPQGKANAYDDTLCGRKDSGQYFYLTLERDEQIPDTKYPICVPCAKVHIDEHYERVGGMTRFAAVGSLGERIEGDAAQNPSRASP